MNEELRILRLKTGEDIVATTIENNEEGITVLKNPMHVTLVTDPQIKKQVMVIRHWLPVSLIKNNIATLFNEDILTIMEPDDEFAEYYSNLVIENTRQMTISEKAEKEEELINSMMELEEAKSNKTIH